VVGVGVVLPSGLLVRLPVDAELTALLRVRRS
jgi:hypothetical protein